MRDEGWGDELWELVLNEFGFETDAEFDTASERRSQALAVIDALQAENVPLDAFGIQGHLSAAGFPRGVRRARTGASSPSWPTAG